MIDKLINEQMIFNIYYINFAKVYEIKMMLSNVITLEENYNLIVLMKKR